ncbi:rhodanese-like domain-containing protein [Tropicibacter sp. S64]|uniref:rhodanese-like domain-containing protein n=1 Tax=Tropicibacter sp. S64 TaxID=3415122 RepID=UPI003C7ED126
MKTETADGATLETWTVDEVQQALKNHDIVLIDVRTPQEYMFEHIPGALLLPMSFVDCASLPGQTDKRIVFHCGSGMRSEKVARKAIAEGFDRIAHMEGGFGAWKSAQKPYMGTNMATGAPQMVQP